VLQFKDTCSDVKYNLTTLKAKLRKQNSLQIFLIKFKRVY